MFGRYSFGRGSSEPRPPPPSMRPFEKLANQLKTGHHRNGGVFNQEAKLDLVRDVWSAILNLQGPSVKVLDSEDPEPPINMGTCLIDDQVLIKDEDGFDQPWSLSASQRRGEYVRRLRGDHWQRDPKGRTCGKVIKRNHRYFTCKTCQMETAFMTCPECFLASDHDGHDVCFFEFRSFFLPCNCGQTVYHRYPQKAGCAHHRIDKRALGQTFPADEALPEAHTWEAFRETAWQGDLPPEYQNLYNVIKLMVDYIIWVFQRSIPTNNWSKLPKTREAFAARLAPYTNMKASESQQGPWSVTVLADDRHSIAEVVRQAQHALGISRGSAELWTKELEDVGRKVAITTDRPTAAFYTASMFQQIDMLVSLRHAYDVYTEEAAGTLISILRDLGDSHINGDSDIFSLLISSAFAETRPYEAQGTLLNPLPEDVHFRYSPYATSHPSQPFVVTPVKLDWLFILDNRLWKRAKLDLRQLYARMYTVNPAIRDLFADRYAVNLIRLVELFLVDERESDTTIMAALTTLLLGTGHPLTLAVGKRLPRDGRPPNAVAHDLVSMIQYWYTDKLVEGKIILPLADPERLVPFSHVEHERMLGFRARKGITIVIQLRGLTNHQETSTIFRDDDVLFDRLVVMFSSFVGLTTQAHKLGDHVKYEQEFSRGFTVMSDISRLSRDIGECLLRIGPSKSGPLSVTIPFDRIRKIISRICADALLETAVLDKDRYTVPVQQTIEGVLLPRSATTAYKLQLYGMLAFSFHHPLHYFLGEYTKLLATYPNEGSETLRDLFRTQVFDHDKLDQDTQMLLVVDQTITKAQTKLTQSAFAVMAQIRCGLWNRNGATLRNQQALYRDLSYREAAHEQEFNLMQLALCTMAPLVFVNALIDRYGLAGAFRGEGRAAHLMPDWTAEWNSDWSADKTDVTPFQMIDLLEDFVWFIISLVSDIDHISNKATSLRCRKAIIQALAVSPLSKYEVERRMPEKASEDCDYVAMLHELATYREPVENMPGIFTLRPEFYPQVDPLHRHWTRNERSAASKALLEELKKAHPDDPNVFVKPLPLEVPPLGSNSVLSPLRELLRGEVAQRLVYYLIGHCIRIGNGDISPDHQLEPLSSRCGELLDATLSLAMLALDNEPTFFAKASADPTSVRLDVADRPTAFTQSDTAPNTLFENLEYMQVDELWEPFLPKINYVIDKIIEHAPSAVTESYQYRVGARKRAKIAAQQAAENPVRLSAAERQKRIMATFARQQANFAANMLEDEEDEDETMEGDGEQADDTLSRGDCIICQVPVDAAHPGGMLALFQPSRLVRDWLLEKDFYEATLSTPCNFDNDTRRLQYGGGASDTPTITDSYPSQHNRFGAFVSACGHMMHDECMTHYYDATRNRHSHQISRNHPENAVRNEYFCPLCKTIGNYIIPTDRSLTETPSLKLDYVDGQPPPLKDHIRSVSRHALKYVSDSTKIWEYHEDAGQLTPWYADVVFANETLDPINRKTTMKPISRMIDRFRHLFRALSEQSADRYRANRKRRAMYIPEDLISYTIACNEIGLRGIPRGHGQSTVAEQMPRPSMTLIKNLIGQLQLELDLFYGPYPNRANLRVGVFTRFLPDYYRAPPLAMPVLLRDPVGLVVEAAAIAPDLVHSVMIMAYYVEICRTIISLSLFIRRSVGIWDNYRSAKIKALHDDNEAFNEDALSIFAGFRPVMSQIIQNTGPYGVGDENVLRHVSDKVIAKLMYMCTLPILRRFAILYRAISGGSYPVTDPSLVLTEGSEYARLLSLLGIPRPTETLLDHKSTEYPLVMRWISLWVQHGRVISNVEWPGIYELALLPRLQEQLVLKQEDRRCSRCRSIPNHPALCLYCGKYVCLAGDCCSDGEQGECNLHMRECGAANGMFLDIRRWMLLILYAGTGSFIQMPYVDQYGDVDHRRFTRMYLSPKRLENYRRELWLGHGIPHVCARKFEPITDYGGWVCL